MGCARSCSTSARADFIRVRMGIGRPPAGFAGDVADYVLSSFERGGARLLPDMVDKAAQATLQVLTEGVERAMNEANTRPKRGRRAAKRPVRATGGGSKQGATVSPPRKRGREVTRSREALASRVEPFGMVPGGSLLQGIVPGAIVHKETSSHGNSSRGAEARP